MRRLRTGKQGPRRAAFVLTPLIDVMFLLLIFFMLSSQIAPYSLLSIGRIATEARPATPSEGPPAASDQALLVSAGAVAIGRQTYAQPELAGALRQLKEKGAAGFVVVATRSARVQDVVATLEALQAIGAGRVTLLNSAGSMP